MERGNGEERPSMAVSGREKLEREIERMRGLYLAISGGLNGLARSTIKLT
jgi:hypothetical protein